MVSAKPMAHPLASRMPGGNSFNLHGLKSDAKTAAIESAYDGGFIGCFDAPDNDDSVLSIGRYDHDQFMFDTPGNHLWSEIHDSLPAQENDNDGCHVYTKDAFETWERDGELYDSHNWIFGIFQDSGNCVDASNVEMKAGFLGYRAKRQEFGEVFKYLPAFWTYCWRGHCGAGWTGAACATQNKLHGWAPAKQYRDIDYDDENESERLVVSSWCRSGPPQWMHDEVVSQFTWETDAITYFDGGLDAFRRLFANGGQFHHGGNYTSASSKPDTWKRIGGHMQTAFGADWSERTVKWFADKGLSLKDGDAWVANHQTWGNWSGACSSSYWPEWWGPQPQGAWVCRASSLLHRVDGYAYLPKLSGVKGSTPPTPPVDTHPKVTGTLHTDAFSPIRGEVVFEGKFSYIVRPRSTADRTYELIPKPSV